MLKNPEMLMMPNLETLVGVAEEALQMRILDELCPDNDYETATIEEIKASEVSSIPISQIDGQDDSLETVHQTAGVIEKNVKLKNQYPRNCEDCGKYLRSSIDFRKHIVACVMARK